MAGAGEHQQSDRHYLPPSARSWIGPAAVTGISLLYYLSYHLTFINLVDEGFQVYGAVRVLDGQTPVTDFWAYPPGRYWVLAGLFKLFGVHLTVERVALAIALAVRNGMIYAVSRRFMSTPMALAIAFTLALVPGPWHKLLYSLLMFVHLTLCLRYVERPTLSRLSVCALAVGGIGWFRQDAALYAGTVTVLSILMCAWFTVGSRSTRVTQRIRATLGSSLRPILVLIVGSIAAIAPMFAIYLSQGELLLALRRMGPDTLRGVGLVYEHVDFRPLGKLPRHVLAQLRGWPDPLFYRTFFPWLAVFLGFLAAAIPSAAGWSRYRGRRFSARQLTMLIVLVAWSLLAARKVYQQPGMETFLMSCPGLVVIAGILTEQLWRWAQRQAGQPLRVRDLDLPALSGPLRFSLAAAWSGVFLFVWISLLSVVVIPVPRLRSGAFSTRLEAEARLNLPRASLDLPADQASTLSRLVDEIQRRTLDTESIFTPRQPMIYFLSERDNSTPVDIAVLPLALPAVAQQLYEHWLHFRPALQVIDLREGWTRRVLRQYPEPLRRAMFDNFTPGPTVDHYLLLVPAAGESAWPQIESRFTPRR